jgi:hypothetical protein
MSNKDITHKSQYGFLTDLLMTGYVMSDPDGLPFLSQYRNKVAELKNKMNKEKDQ